MARMPGAEWIGPTVNEYPGGMVERRGLVLHVEQSNNNANVDTWFKDPAAQASSHFTNPKLGGLQQLVDTDDAAWTEMAGNRHWVSVEHEGYSGDSLTESQIENDAQLLAWLHITYGVPLAGTDDPNGMGLGWHGMGGDAWGGHFDCPGEPIKAQRDAIIARAGQLLALPAPAPVPARPDAPAWADYDGHLIINPTTSARVSMWQAYMVWRGWHLAIDGAYGPLSEAVCRQFQAEKGLRLVDGKIGPDTWRTTHDAPIT